MLTLIYCHVKIRSIFCEKIIQTTQIKCFIWSTQLTKLFILKHFNINTYYHNPIIEGLEEKMLTIEIELLQLS